MALITQPATVSTPATAILITAANSYWGSKLVVSLVKRGHYVLGLHNQTFSNSLGERVLRSLPQYQRLTTHTQLKDIDLEAIILSDIYISQLYSRKLTKLQTDTLFAKLQYQLHQLQSHPNVPLAILASYRQLQPHKANLNYSFNSYLFHFVVKQCVTHNRDYRVVFVEDLVAKNMPLSPVDPLHRLLQKRRLRPKQSINLHNRCYPLSIDDAAQGLLKALFVPHTVRKNLLLAGNSISLSTVSSFLELKTPRTFSIPSMKPDKHAGIIDEQLSLETRRLLNWKPQQSSLELIRQIAQPTPIKPPTHSQKKPQKETLLSSTVPLIAKKTLQFSRYTYFHQQALQKQLILHSRKIVSVGVISLILLTVPFLIYSFFLVKSAAYAYLGYQAVKQGEWNSARYKTRQAVAQLQTIDPTQPLAEKVQQVPISKHLVQHFQPQISLYTQLIHTLNHLTAAGDSANQLLKQVLVPTTTTNPSYNLEYFDQLFTDLSILEAKLPATRPTWLTPFIKQTTYAQYHQQLPTIKRGLQQVTAIAPIVQYLNQQTEPVTIAILLQNNNELRPTGGFIGSFALLTFESGTITQKKIYDVYDADGQLKGYVRPPEPIEKYLGEVSWYLRDANWDPDFPTTAQRVQWFIQKELDTQVDGVVAIDLDAVTNILKAVGPLDVTEIPTPITHENIHTYLQTEIESEFFPGSHRKKYLLTAINESLISKLKNLDRQQTLDLAINLQDTIQQKHLQVWFNDQQLQQQIETQPWSGKLSGSQSSTSIYVRDQIRLIEANVGVNKSNQFIDRTTQHTLDFVAPDRVDHTIRINYFNRSTQETKIEGTYKNFLRTYIPTNATFEGALILRTLNTELLPEVKVYLPDPIHSETEHEQQVTGFLVTVAPKENVTVEIKYSLPLEASEPEFNYHLSIPKQFGLSNNPYSFKIITDKHYQLLESNHYLGQIVTTLTSEPVLTYNTEMSTDQQLHLKLTKK